MTGFLGSELPIVGAPMAGGPSSPDLVRAVGDAGGLPFVAGGYTTPAALADAISAARSGGGPFGVNLFAPNVIAVDRAAFDRYTDSLRPEAERVGVELGVEPIEDDDAWAAKIDLLLADPVPIVSVTFGLPAPSEVAALERAGTRVLATVTSVAEARAAVAVGASGLIAQGTEAGGHSARHDPRAAARPIGAADLVAAVAAQTRVPVIAAGGVAGPADVARLIGAGAAAVAVGTLLLRTVESGASATHKNALADPRFAATVLTHAFTGRPARALRNRFVERHGAEAPLGYPALHHLTRPLRQAAASAGDAESLHLWAGTGYRSAAAEPAGDVVRRLAAGL